MSTHDAICQAIREKKLLQFFYDGGTRVVEPHQFAYNKKDNIALSAYWVRGYSESQDMSSRWREYLFDLMSAIIVLDEHFVSPRPGYKRAPNQRFHSAICEL
jgi:predicted DNA-binding transcriptional regulator YafY